MSGRRCKALRASFRKRFGHAPAKTEITGHRGIFTTYTPSEWRRLKKEYLEAKRA